MCRDLSFDGMTTPNTTPLQSPRRESVYGLRTPSSLGSPRLGNQDSPHPKHPFHTEQPNSDGGSTTFEELCPDCRYPEKRNAHSAWCIRHPDRLTGQPPEPVPEKQPRSKSRPLADTPPTNLLPPQGTVQSGVHNGQGKHEASSSSAWVRPTERSSSNDTRGRGGASSSDRVDQSRPASSRGTGGSRSPRPSSQYESYYRTALYNLDHNRGAQNVSMNVHGRYEQTREPPRGIPLHEVREGDVNRRPRGKGVGES